MGGQEWSNFSAKGASISLLRSGPTCVVRAIAAPCSRSIPHHREVCAPLPQSDAVEISGALRLPDLVLLLLKAVLTQSVIVEPLSDTARGTTCLKAPRFGSPPYYRAPDSQASTYPARATRCET